MGKKSTLPDSLEDKIRDIILDAMSKRPVVHINLHVPLDVDPDRMAMLIRRVLADFQPAGAAPGSPPPGSSQ